MSFWNKNYHIHGRTRHYKPQHFPLKEQKQLYNSLRAAFKLASRSIVVGHKENLGIAYNTARAHMGNIFRKVGVRGKAGLILEFIKVLQKAKI